MKPNEQCLHEGGNAGEAVGAVSDEKYSMDDAIERRGIGEVETIDDGILHRFPTYDDKPGQTSGWYVSHGKRGAFGDWKSGRKFKFNGGKLSAEERLVIQERNQKSKAEREADLIQAKKNSQMLWEHAGPVDEHTYLATKRIKAYGVKVMNNILLVPMYYQEELVNLQRIFPDSKKWFMPGAQVKGCYCVLGELDQNVLICEGYATACSLHEYTGETVVIAFNAGNLAAVAIEMKRQVPDGDFIIMGDNDVATEERTGINPGVVKATEAADAIDARLMYPNFEDEPFEGTDFNDYLVQGGVL